MSRKSDLPSPTRVTKALDELLEASRSAGRQPSVLDLARRLGLSNTTFRRNFPEAVQKIAAARSPRDQSATADRPSPNDRFIARNAKLRRSNRELGASLKLATAQIHKLTLLNHQLTRALEAASTVTRLNDARRRTSTKSRRV